jgi:hypothetical protein
VRKLPASDIIRATTKKVTAKERIARYLSSQLIKELRKI